MENNGKTLVAHCKDSDPLRLATFGMAANQSATRTINLAMTWVFVTSCHLQLNIYFSPGMHGGMLRTDSLVNEAVHRAVKPIQGIPA